MENIQEMSQSFGECNGSYFSSLNVNILVLSYCKEDFILITPQVPHHLCRTLSYGIFYAFYTFMYTSHEIRQQIFEGTFPLSEKEQDFRKN